MAIIAGDRDAIELAGHRRAGVVPDAATLHNVPTLVRFYPPMTLSLTNISEVPQFPTAVITPVL